MDSWEGMLRPNTFGLIFGFVLTLLADKDLFGRQRKNDLSIKKDKIHQYNSKSPFINSENINFALWHSYNTKIHLYYQLNQFGFN